MAKRNTFGVDEKLETPFNIKHLLRAGKYIKRHGIKMLISLMLSSVTAVVALYIPKISQWVLDDAVPNKDYSYLLRLLLIYVGILLVSILLNVIRARLMAHAAQGIIYDIREDLFAHLQKLPFTYYDSRPTGKILVRVVNYVNSVADILSNGILNMIMECITLILVAVFMFTTDVKLAFVIVAGLPIFVGWILLIKPRQRRAWQAQSNKNSNFNAYLAESLEGAKVSELFARQGSNVDTCKELLSACRKTWMDAIYISNSVWLFSVILTQVVSTFLYLTGVYWYGGGLIVSFASPAPLYRINSATIKPTIPSTLQLVTASITAASSTAAVVKTSLRLSAEVASKADDWIWFPSRLLNTASHSFTAMEPARTSTVTAEKLTGEGAKIFSTEDFANSKPMTTIIAATASPDKYSKRAWP